MLDLIQIPSSNALYYTILLNILLKLQIYLTIIHIELQAIYLTMEASFFPLLNREVAHPKLWI